MTAFQRPAEMAVAAGRPRKAEADSKGGNVPVTDPPTQKVNFQNARWLIRQTISMEAF